MAERTTRQRVAQPVARQSGKEAAGPKTAALAQLATALNASPPVQRLEAPKRKLARRGANRTGLPDNVKSGVEALSGLSMDHVRVHYNSPRPAQLNAHAFAQGSDIHVAPGQQRHVPHEAWHVVQQAQGRVRATAQMKGGVAINDDKALESEADRVGRMVAQPMSRVRSDGTERPPPVPAAPVGQRKVIQAVRSLATFQAQTPKTLLSPRKQIVQIDAALDAYIGAGAGKLGLGNALVTAINQYIAQGGHAATRVAVVTQLRAEVTAELPLVTALGANAGLTDELIRRAGGAGAIGQLTALATAITPAEAGVLPQLVTLSLPNLAQLDLLIQHIQPANAHMLVGLIAAVGGHAHLVQLDNIVQHATAAHALELYTLIPAGIGAGLPALDALIVAAGAANVPALRGMIAGAGGHGSIAALTGAINLHHPGQGQHAVPLTSHTAGDPAEFQRLAALLPEFAQAAPGAVPAGIQPELDAYNAVGHPAVIGTVTIPLNRRINHVEWAHFLQRHTMHYFDFGGIGPVNDQWPFAGAGADAQVEALVIGGLQTVRAGSGAPNWWLAPNVARPVVTGAFTAQMGTKTPGPPIGGVPSTILGQFYPVAGAGIHRLNAADMHAIRPLL